LTLTEATDIAQSELTAVEIVGCEWHYVLLVVQASNDNANA